MRKRMYQLRDCVANCLVGPILLERSDPPAVRSFYMTFENPQSQLAASPQDYELVCIGTHDDEDGIVDGDYSVVATGKDWLKDKERAANAGA